MRVEYTELSIHANIYLSICNARSSSLDYTTTLKFQLNVDHAATYDIVLSIVFQMIGIISQTFFLFDGFNVLTRFKRFSFL